MGFTAPKITLVAAGNISPARFVTLNGTAFQVAQSTTSDTPYGVSQLFTRAFDSAYAAIANDPVGIYSNSELCLLECGTTITAAQYLSPDSSGRAIPTSGVSSGAVALQGGNTGDYIQVEVFIDTN